MKKLRIVVCDDNPQDLQNYSLLCRRLGEKYKIDLAIKDYTSGDSLLFDMENPQFFSKVDIIFLDIRMPGSDGIQVANEVRRLGYNGIIIFITVSDKHYEDAFDAKAFNYVRKGREFLARFEKIFLEAVKTAENAQQDIVIFSCCGEFRQILIKDISYFEIVKNIIVVHYNDDSFEFVSSLGKIEEQLYGHGFQRVHRSFLISLYYVQSYTYGELTMTDGTKIPVSRKYNQDLKEALNEMVLMQKAK